MKVLWIIDRLDGIQEKVVTTESTVPVPGDGKIINGIPVAVGSIITTPLSGQRGKHDLAIAAREQEI